MNDAPTWKSQLFNHPVDEGEISFLLGFISSDYTDEADSVEYDVPLSSSALTKIFGAWEGKNMEIRALLLTPHDYADLRVFSRDLLDPNSLPATTQVGVQAFVGNIGIVTSPHPPMERGTGWLIIGMDDDGWLKQKITLKQH